MANHVLLYRLIVSLVRTSADSSLFDLVPSGRLVRTQKMLLATPALLFSALQTLALTTYEATCKKAQGAAN